MRHTLSRFLGAWLGFVVAGGLALLVAQGIRVMSSTGTTLAKITVNNALEVVFGKSDRASYIASVGNQAVTATDSILNLHAGASVGFRIVKVCITPGYANSSGQRLWQLTRRTTAPSAGVSIGAEGTTGNNALAKMDPADANWSGTAAIGGTEGNAGAILDSGNLFVPLAVAGATKTDYTSVTFCHQYGTNGDKLPTIAAGTDNGVSLMFSGVTGGTGVGGQIHFISN